MTDAAATTPVPVPDSAPDATQQRARRLRLRSILVIAVLAGLTLITTTQTWWTVTAEGRSIVVPGTSAAPALSALSLCGLALAAALAIAGPLFRFVLGVLQVLLGFTVTLLTILTLSSPAGASGALVSKATGIAGDASIRALITAVSEAAWGYVAVVLGVLSLLAGLFVLVTFRRWPVASRKYSAVRFEEADPAGVEHSTVDDDPTGSTAIADWDSLSEGDDPTAGYTR